MVEAEYSPAAAHHRLEFVFQFLANFSLALLQDEFVDPAAKRQFLPVLLTQFNNVNARGRLNEECREGISAFLEKRTPSWRIEIEDLLRVNGDDEK